MTGKDTKTMAHAHRTRTFRATDATGAISEGISDLLGTPGRAGEGLTTIVFAGEGATPSDAILAALEDILAQAADHGVAPVDVATDAMMATDTGTRIWGTVTCRAEAVETAPFPRVSGMTLEQEQDGRWNLTITTG
jgi:hypothetical protein